MTEVAQRCYLPRVTSSKRRAQIVSSLRTKGAASVRELAESLQVSESTIRRDLDVLDRNGELLRTYGGAALSPRSAKAEISFAASAEHDSAEKEAVAERAAAMVEDDMVVLLDIGTSTRLIARRLRGRPVTVITANLAVLDELREDEAVRLCMLGGVVRRNYLSLVGMLTETALGQVRADLLFLSCTGVRPDGHVMDDMEVETPIKQAMLGSADRVALVASEAKFPGTGSMRVCSLAQIDALVTTGGADPTTLEVCRQAGGKVYIA